MKAESKFLIAYFYYLLVNSYGAVSFQDGLADLNTPTEELSYCCHRKWNETLHIALFCGFSPSFPNEGGMVLRFLT
jgi:hypothetical protein